MYLEFLLQNLGCPSCNNDEHKLLYNPSVCEKNKTQFFTTCLCVILFMIVKKQHASMSTSRHTVSLCNPSPFSKRIPKIRYYSILKFYIYICKNISLYEPIE